VGGSITATGSPETVEMTLRNVPADVARRMLACIADVQCSACDDAFMGYTEAELKAAWGLVPTDPQGWKMPIKGTVPAGSDTAAMSAALAYYCGSPSEFVKQADGSYTVEAPGYYACIGS
jgi:hypothetical protein